MPSWKLSLPCPREVAERLADDVPGLAALESPPVLMTSEPDPARPDDWRLDVYVEQRPDAALLTLVAGLVPGATVEGIAVRELPDEDWLTLSQAGLEPIRAGRFVVYTSTHADMVPEDALAIRIEAGRAFGTGQHETTTGCLTMLDRLDIAPTRALDLGTGSGILALAMVKRWRTACVTATDIDPVSIEVTVENTVLNGEATGDRPGAIESFVADGPVHERLTARGPYDLIAANILAQPLIDMADGIAALLAPGGRLLLAGLLNSQAERVAAAYEAVGLKLAVRHDVGEWPTLVLERR
jgi:ribosomal protein L11 methyltransferase